MKNKKTEWHAPKTQYGAGDYYGVGVKNKVGKPISIMGINPTSKGKMAKSPKSLA